MDLETTHYVGVPVMDFNGKEVRHQQNRLKGTRKSYTHKYQTMKYKLVLVFDDLMPSDTCF